jgi:hypothetical protein
MKKFLRVCILAAIGALPACGWAWEGKPASLESWGVLAGFGTASLREQGAYHTVPLSVDFDFTLKPYLKEFGLSWPGMVQMQIEPYLAPVIDPHAGIELGNYFFLKIGLVPQTWKFQPYVKAGPGVSYMTVQTREQATQFNFIEAGAVGAHFFFRKNLGLTVECRARHLSNSGIAHPNKGINSYYGMLGVAYLF